MGWDDMAAMMILKFRNYSLELIDLDTTIFSKKKKRSHLPNNWKWKKEGYIGGKYKFVSPRPAGHFLSSYRYNKYQDFESALSIHKSSKNQNLNKCNIYIYIEVKKGGEHV